jgi:hypothetical protein
MYLLLLCISCSQIAGKDIPHLGCDFPAELIGKVALSILALSDSVNENIPFALSARTTSHHAPLELLIPGLLHVRPIYWIIEQLNSIILPIKELPSHAYKSVAPPQ